MSNKVHVHEMTGIKPDALATYLAGLGMFRLFAEQKDRSARGFWRDEHFVLVTELDWESVERFFLQEYQPTPILAPWNMESGFFSLKPPNADRDDARGRDATSATTRGEDGEASLDAEFTDDGDTAANEGDVEGDEEEAIPDPLIERIASSTTPRLASFRSAINAALEVIPDELRRAEADSQRAYREMRAQLTAALAQAEQAVLNTKADVEAKKAELKGTKSGSAAEEALARARTRFKQAQQHAKATKAQLKTKEKELKVPVNEAKKLFKDLQAATKARLIAELRLRWGDEGQQWVDAAIGLDETREKGFEFTSLFGSGGNDGRMEFTRNFRRHLNAIFDIDTGQPRELAADRLRATVRAESNSLLISSMDGRELNVGQLFPGRAGGTNMASGFAGKPTINPWEFVLMLEGAVALVAGVTRRGAVGPARVSSPFWVKGTPAGFASASELEGSLRGEQWLPLWSEPLRYGELVELMREGRAQVSGGNATTAGDLVRAAARLGLARGIQSLQRFAYLKRNGQSHFAVSAGRFRVAPRLNQALLDEIAPWIDRLAEHAREKNVPLRLRVIARQTQEALFAVCRHEATPTEWRQLLIVLGDAELALLRSGENPARRPLPRLSGGWIPAVDDGSEPGRTTLRLALALASQHRPPDKNDLPLKGSVRCHFLPLVDPDGERPRFRLDERTGRAKLDPECVCVGRNLVTDAIALVRRRSVWARPSDARRERAPQLPLWAVNSCEATLDEIGWWLRNDQFDDDVLRLVRPLLALDWVDVSKRNMVPRSVCRQARDPLQMLFRLAHLPFDVPVLEANGKREIAVTVRLDPEPLRRLAAGDVDGALRVAVRRLNASGLRPVFRRGLATAKLARRLAASLAFPISQGDAARAAGMVCKPYEAKEDEEQSLLLSI